MNLSEEKQKPLRDQRIENKRNLLIMHHKGIIQVESQHRVSW